MVSISRERLKEYWPWCLLGAATAIHLLMMGSLFWGYLNPLFDNSDNQRQAIDFFSIYEAGHRALDNVSLYNYDWLRPAEAPYYLVYRYLPIFAYGFAVPATVIPPWWAYWGWVAFNELLTLANAYATWRIAGKGRWGLIAAAMWFVFTPFYLEQYMGQFSFLMATLLFWSGIGIARGREAAAGPPWAVSLVVKSNSAVLLPLFLRIGWWRSFLGGVALVGLNLPYFLFRPEDLEWFHRANIRGIYADHGTRVLNYQAGTQDAVAFLRNSLMALDPTSDGIPAALPIALIAAVVGLSLAATALSLKNDPLTLFAIWASTYFLTYGAWEHHYVMYLPVAVLLVALRASIRPWALMAFAFVALPTPYWLMNNVWNTGPPPMLNLQAAWPAWGVILHHAAKPVPVFLLWAYLIVSQFREGVGLRWPSALCVPWQRIYWLRSQD